MYVKSYQQFLNSKPPEKKIHITSTPVDDTDSDMSKFWKENINPKNKTMNQIKVDIYVSPKSGLHPEHYLDSINGEIAGISTQDHYTFVHITEGESKTRRYHYFTIQKRKLSDGSIVAQTNTTNYHKAIGLAVAYNL